MDSTKTQNQNNEQTQMRTCIVTGERHFKADMIRLVSFRGENIQIDLTGKKPGRGASISANTENVTKLLEKNGAILARAFKKQIKKEELEYLKTELPKAIEEKLFRPRASKPVSVRIKKEDLQKI